MNLDEAQRKQVSAWIEEGLRLSDIQKRMESDLGVRMTYLEVRLLVDELNLTPKDQPEPERAPSLGKANAAAPPAASEPAPATGQVSVTVDNIARPGAVVSGNVTFGDGEKAGWHLDQMGRLGLAPDRRDYKPSAQDLQSFQAALQRELEKMGF